jgi:hypothetical protein
MSALEDSLFAELQLYGLPTPERQHRFCERRWRLDFAWPNKMLACEINGGLYVQGRHNRGAQLEQEFEKINAAQILGYRVLLFGPKACHIPKNGSSAALEVLDRVLR